MHLNIRKLIYCLLIVSTLAGCKKLVEVPQPANTVTDTKTFSNDVNAVSAITAIYSDMIASAGGSSLKYSNLMTTICAGLYADELNDYLGFAPQFQENTILPDDGNITLFWTPAYYHIYMANAVIENLESSSGVSAATKKQLTGEARFLRAFCYFYLVNLFGDVPLVTITDWRKINLLPRSPQADIYKQMEDDLQQAQTLLQADYSASHGEKIRANIPAAQALLARVYLFEGKWQQAEAQASSVINSGTYRLLDNLRDVFLKNSDEAILQLQVPDADYYATVEGNKLLPDDPFSSPYFTLTDQLFNDFEQGDQRRQDWVDSTDFGGTFYYYPAKYRVKTGSPGNITEYYTLLRFSEQYLIRAEARAQQNHLSDAIGDLNLVRSRALLPALPDTLTQPQILAALLHERRIELFSEWGHRWFDLKRTGQANTVLAPVKPGWNANSQLWPIPSAELIRDPNLTQNPGY